ARAGDHARRAAAQRRGRQLIFTETAPWFHWGVGRPIRTLRERTLRPRSGWFRRATIVSASSRS
ncbi:MAG TPA: hypothetical protein VJT78_08755, partial [Candidatus Dormibacteraeota bacterium]|nr:hypothetical protein [Candidatus Dormibacteraeota bacterium]